MAELVEICLEIAGDPPQVRLHRIDRSGPGTVLLELAPLDRAALANHDQGLGYYQRNDPGLVPSGCALFAALSTGAVGQAWQRLRREHGADLCTYLRIQPRDLATLPWELITDGLRPFVTAGPVSHSIDCPPPSDNIDEIWPVRVLVINGSNPADIGIKADEEVWTIRQALRRAEHSFDLEVYETASADASFDPGVLVAATTQRWPRGPHIIHFIGHSVATPNPALQYYLSAAGAFGRWSLAQIAGAIDRFPDLRLVYVNACRSQQAGPDPAAPWSVASTLLGRAVAVIAMQSDISGEGAVACAGRFYGALADGLPVGAALVAGRQALLDVFSEASRELYAPVFTTRVAVRDILRMRRFGWDRDTHTAWQKLLKENWEHFVNQHPHRRRLYNALFEPAPRRRGLVVLGDNSVGKSWLVKWSTYAMALNGLQVQYLPADQSLDWLALLRRLRDGCAALNCPGLDPELRSEFNWKLNHLARGQAPPPYVAGQVVNDTAGSHAEVIQRGQQVNDFAALVCEAMVHALRGQARGSPLVLVLDSPSLTVAVTLKVALLDAIVGGAAGEAVRVILCCHNKHWASYEEHGLNFSSWLQIEVSEIDRQQIAGLIRELLRLQFPSSARDAPQRLSEVELFLVNTPAPGPIKAEDLYKLCQTIGTYKGLHV